MKHRNRTGVKVALAVMLVSAGSGLLVRAQLPQPVGAWAALGAVADARTGAAAVALEDGRTLIAGGQNASGEATASVVIYDPATHAVSGAGELLLPRVGHTATLLADGRVLVAGGTADGLVSTDIELFDPAAGSSVLAAAMGEPRMGHAAARLSDGRVLLAGGLGAGGEVLGTAEVFDLESAGTIYLTAALQTPRAAASATTLVDGRVLVAGGYTIIDGNAVTLDTAEVFDGDGAFTTASSRLGVARSGHAAILLPYNNSVLVAGGSSSGGPVTSAELFLPGELAGPPQSAGRFAATGEMTTARTGAIGGPGYTEGYVFVAGGGSTGSEAYRFATVKSDRNDYAPGETVVISGSGWESGETVRLTLVEAPEIHERRTIEVVADESGSISDDGFRPEAHDLGVRFYLTAAGQSSARIARTTFTDGVVQLKLATAGTDIPAAQRPTFTWRVNYDLWAGNAASTTCTSSNSPTARTATYTGDSPGAGQSGAPSPNQNQSVKITSVQPTGTFAAQYAFDYWSNAADSTVPVTPGCITGTAGGGDITTLYAHFRSVAPATFTVTFNQSGIGGDTGSNDVLTVGANTYTAAQFPVVLSFASGSTVSYSYSTPVAAGVAKRYVLTGTTGPASSFTVNANTTIEATYKTQHKLTLATAPEPGIGGAGNPSATPSSTDGFYDKDTVVSLAAAATVSIDAGSRWRFDQWSGGATGTTSPVNVTMDAAKTVMANYVKQFLVTFTAAGTIPIGADSDSEPNTVVTVNGNPKTAAALLFSDWFDKNSTVTYVYAPTVASASDAGKRFALTTPSPVPASPLTVTAPLTVVGTYKTQFLMTFTASVLPTGASSVTGGNTVVTINDSPLTAGALPFSEWFDQGAAIAYTFSTPISTVPVSDKQYELASVSGPASPFSVMGAATVTGNYTLNVYSIHYRTPIDESSGSSYVINAGKNGRVIPVKVDIFKNGVPILVGNVRMRVAGSNCAAGSNGDPIEEYADAGSSSGGTDLFRLTDGFWIYNLDTRALGLVTNNCYRLDVYYGELVPTSTAIKLSHTVWAIFKPVK